MQQNLFEIPFAAPFPEYLLPTQFYVCFRCEDNKDHNNYGEDFV